MSGFAEHADLAGYVTGEVTAGDEQKIESHLAGCAGCRAEVGSLREVQELLAELPPEALLAGPPEDADLLLQRTLRQVRSEARSSAGRTRFLAATAAVVVAAAALGIGVLVGKSGTPSGPAVAAPPAPVPSSASSTVAGTKFISGTAGDARLTASIVPAAGWVRIEAAVTGVPAGEKCRLIVVGKNGARAIAGSWLVSPKAVHDGVELNGSALVAPSEVASVVVENTDGHRFVAAKA